MENFTEKNLIAQSWWNPFTALATNNKGYELNNVIIYNEDGIIVETGCGWFREQYSNNNTFKDGATIDAIHLRKSIDLTKKENFIIKDSERSYETRYILYIYYKNVNFKALEIKRDGLWIEGLYQIELPEKTVICEQMFGKTEMKSDNIKYQYYKTIENLEKQKFSKPDELLKAIKKLEKEVKQYEKMKIQEKEDIYKNIYEFIYEGNIQKYNMFKSMLDNKEVK